MTNPPTDERREAFEKWAGAKGHALHIRDMKGSTRLGEYGYADTQRLWETWQAALSHQGDVVKVSELRALVDPWEGFTKAFDRPDSGYTNEKIVGHRRALTHDLTALISKAEKV